jgi:homopolymeric O-antigen transport system permease protein
VTAATEGLGARARRTRDTLTVLTKSDLGVRYGRGRVRFLKWVLDPFAALGVYLLLIAFVLDEGTTAAGLSLACAIVPFQLLLSSSVNALSSVQIRHAIILNMRFPRVLIPVSSVVTESVAFLATLTLLPLMMVAYGVEPTTAIVWLPVAIAVTIILALALACPCMLFGIWFPELQTFAISVARAAFFLAPGLVALDQITGQTRDLPPVNPLTGLFESYRDALLYGHAPAAWELLVPLGAAAAVAAISVPVFLRERSQLAKLVG